MEHLLSLYNSVIEELNLTNKPPSPLAKGKDEPEFCFPVTDFPLLLFHVGLLVDTIVSSL